jgi:hypothetical protein
MSAMQTSGEWRQARSKQAGVSRLRADLGATISRIHEAW